MKDAYLVTHTKNVIGGYEKYRESQKKVTIININILKIIFKKYYYT